MLAEGARKSAQFHSSALDHDLLQYTRCRALHMYISCEAGVQHAVKSHVLRSTNCAVGAIVFLLFADSLAMNSMRQTSRSRACSFTAPRLNLARAKPQAAKPQTRDPTSGLGFGSSASSTKRKKGQDKPDYMTQKSICPCGSGKEFEVCIKRSLLCCPSLQCCVRIYPALKQVSS